MKELHGALIRGALHAMAPEYAAHGLAHGAVVDVELAGGHGQGDEFERYANIVL